MTEYRVQYVPRTKWCEPRYLVQRSGGVFGWSTVGESSSEEYAVFLMNVYAEREAERLNPGNVTRTIATISVGESE